MKKSIKIIAILTILALALALASCDIKGTIEQYSQNIYDMIMSNQGYLKEDEQFKNDTSSAEIEQNVENNSLIEDENA